MAFSPRYCCRFDGFSSAWGIVVIPASAMSAAMRHFLHQCVPLHARYLYRRPATGSGVQVSFRALQRLGTLLRRSTPLASGCAAAITLTLQTSAWHPPVAPTISRYWLRPSQRLPVRNRTCCSWFQVHCIGNRDTTPVRFHVSLLLLSPFLQDPLLRSLILFQAYCTPLEYTVSPDNVFPFRCFFMSRRHPLSLFGRHLSFHASFNSVSYVVRFSFSPRCTHDLCLVISISCSIMNTMGCFLFYCNATKFNGRKHCKLLPYHHANI